MRSKMAITVLHSPVVSKYVKFESLEVHYNAEFKLYYLPRVNLYYAVFYTQLKVMLWINSLHKSMYFCNYVCTSMYGQTKQYSVVK